jgi:hypothetical protein
MEKELFVVRGLPGEPYGGFITRMIALAGETVRAAGPAALKVTLTQRRPPALSVIPYKRTRVAVFSVLGGGEATQQSMVSAKGFDGSYRVREVLPVTYEKTWEDGTETPGACLLTLFHCKPGLDREQFFTRWFEGHTPLSLRIHPLWNYTRNEVLEATSGNSPWFDGIVEEQFNPASDLLNPLRFFGPPFRVPAHMLEVLRDTRSFIDMKRIETYLAAEYHIKS